MTPAQPLIPFLLQLAAFERDPAGRREPAKAACDVLPVDLDLDAATEAHDAHDADDEGVTIVRADLRSPRAAQLPRAPLFSQRGAAVGRIPARGSSPDLRRR